MADNLQQAAPLILTDLINRSNPGAALVPAYLTFGAVSVETGARNTGVTVSAVQGSGYKGSQAVTYDRLDLTTDIANVAGLSLAFPVGDAVMVSEFLAEFNSRFQTGLTADDIVDGPVPEFVGSLNEEHPADLVAAASSYIYLGQVTLTLQGDELDLADVIAVTELDGLTYEAPV